MSTWDERLLTCMHGVEEDLDYHSCQYCQRIAKGLGYEVITDGAQCLRKTYLFTSQKQVNKLKKEAKKS